MSDNVVTGNSVEGQLGSLHREDVVFRFTGSRPDQLLIDAFYQGSVDGYADFGVFVDVGEVTGLLHRSEIPGRLESLDWEPGDTVYVKVTNVRDNGNVDLGWSIRGSEEEFRGAFVHDPTGDYEPEESEPESGSETDEGADEPRVTPGPRRGPKPGQQAVEEDTDGDRTAAGGGTGTDTGSNADATGEGASEGPAGGAGDGAAMAAAESEAESGGETDTESRSEADAEPADLERVGIGDLGDRVGRTVRLEGVVTGVRQTSGPTIFELQDETGTVDCAAFVEAGVRAYPEAEAGDHISLDGEVRERRGELQVETERLEVLDEEAAARVESRMAGAIEAEASVSEQEPLAGDAAVEAAIDEVREAATAIRRAVIEQRPVIVRHDATVDGYLAGAAIERATLPLVREEHSRADAPYHYFDRRPLEGVYTMDDATKDVTRMLSARDRHDEKLPLLVFAGTGTTRDSFDGFELLSIYGAERVVIDGGDADGAVTDAVQTVVNPELAGADGADASATALATAVAVHVNDEVRADLRHLPAVSVWEEPADAYRELAEEAGFDGERRERLQEAIALAAHYQSYEDKRELVTDLLFGGPDREGLVEQVSDQFREKLALEVETAEANLERRAEGGVAFAVLDTASFTHKYDFPPTELLLEELHRRHRDGAFVTLGADEDEILIRSSVELDVREVADRVAEAVPDAGVAARGGADRIEFVAGERERVLDATVEAVAAVA
jgi:RecJ-like exonuclease